MLNLFRANRETDLQLAKHITYVHQHNINPPQAHVPLDMKTIRRYINLCKQKSPTIPASLTDHIVNQYCVIRSQARYKKIRVDRKTPSPKKKLSQGSNQQNII